MNTKSNVIKTMNTTNNEKTDFNIDYKAEIILNLAQVTQAKNTGLELEENICALYYYGRKYATENKISWVNIQIGKDKPVQLCQSKEIKEACFLIINCFTMSIFDSSKIHKDLALKSLKTFLEHIEL